MVHRGYAPIADAVVHCLHQSSGRVKWPNYVRSFHLLCRYCITPPVTPFWSQAGTQEYLRVENTRHVEKCIACGRVHVTSEDCGIERPEPQFRDSRPRQHDGYSLERARNMGMFDDADNWD